MFAEAIYSELETKLCRNIPHCTKCMISATLHQKQSKTSVYGQEIPQSQIADQPTTP